MNGDYETFEPGEVARILIPAGLSLILFRYDPNNKQSKSDWEIQQITGPVDLIALVVDPQSQVPLYNDERAQYVSYVYVQDENGSFRREGWVGNVHLHKQDDDQ